MRCAPLSNPAAIRISRPGWTPPCPRRSSGCGALCARPGGGLGIGTRGRGSEGPRRRSGGFRPRNISNAASPGRSIPRGNCCSGSSSNSPRASPIARKSWRCRGSASPNWGPAISASRSATSRCRATPIRRRCAEARDRVFAACRKNRVAFLETCSPGNIAQKLDEGVRVIAGHREDTAIIGRAHQRRTVPV